MYRKEEKRNRKGKSKKCNKQNSSIFIHGPHVLLEPVGHCVITLSMISFFKEALRTIQSTIHIKHCKHGGARTLVALVTKAHARRALSKCRLNIFVGENMDQLYLVVFVNISEERLDLAYRIFRYPSHRRYILSETT